MAPRLTDYAVCAEILAGEYDDHLDYIEQSITARRRALDRAVQAGPGSRFTSHAGETGTVTKVNVKRYYGVFDTDYDRVFSIPKAMVTVHPSTAQERAAQLRLIGH